MTEQLEITTNGALGVIALNRPQAINALSLEMIAGITDTLTAWRDDPAIRAVLFEGRGPKGFCSGGDVRAARALVVEGRPEGADAYFGAEYAMNGLIATYPKPLIAITHGIVMGGGIGIAGHCRYRITQPGARFAMPEPAIGLFADVGVNAILAKTSLNRALLFIMTGATVGTADALALGLADAVIAPERVEAMRSDLAGAAGSTYVEQSIMALMAAETIDRGEASFTALADTLPADFDSPADFVDQVAALPALADYAALLATRSPGSLVANFFAQNRARRVMDVTRTLDMDLKLAGVMARRPDFTEGVRAVLVDKDQKPVWSPATLAAFDVQRDAGPILQALRLS